jgi:negative regulator of sigma E activity
MKESFENQWAKAAKNAEINPPAGTWEAIDLMLNKADKKKSVFFLWNKYTKMGIAASIALFGLVGVLYFNQTNSTGSLAKDASSKTAPLPKKDLSNTAVKGSESYATPSPDEQTLVPRSSNNYESTINEIRSIQKPLAASSRATANKHTANVKQGEPASVSSIDLLKVEQSTGSTEPILAADQNLKAFNAISYSTMKGKALQEIKVKNILPRNKLAVSEIEFMEVTANKPKKTWLGLQSGYMPFDPSFNGQSHASESSSAASANADVSFASQKYATNASLFESNDVNAAVTSYERGPSSNFGVDLGKKINKRMFLASGIRYAHAQVTQNTNSFKLDPLDGTLNTGFEANFKENTEISKSLLSNVTVQNKQTFNYLQIPVYVGYTVPLVKNLDLEFLSGLSNDIFLNSKIEGDLVEAENFTAKNSRFKNLNFSFLAGLGLNLKLSKHLNATVNTSAQKALFSGLEGNIAFKPRFAGINYGIRYIQ